MLLRRVIAHFRKQEWTAIAIDFLIVVVGVFVGLQVNNWNEAQSDKASERALLGELRAELVESIEQLKINVKAFDQVGRSGARAIAFLDAGEPCGDDCWGVIVDFFHASQWQQINVTRSTYDEMRRNGWPRNRDIVGAHESYHRQAEQNAQVMYAPPAYRALVRGLIPLAIHRPYWVNCLVLINGEEEYVEDCPEGVAPEISAAGVAAIIAHPDIHPTLTEWTGFAGGMSITLISQAAAAEHAIALIDQELGIAP